MGLKFNILLVSIKNDANVSFSGQSKIFPKPKSQTLSMRYQNVQEGFGITVERKNLKFAIFHHVLVSQKLLFFEFLKHKLDSVFTLRFLTD